MLPSVWLNAWFYSGLAGSVVSMISYVLATRYLYRIAHGLTGNRSPGGRRRSAAANPNVLYLQSTPIPDVLLIACISADRIYHLMRWCQTARTGNGRRRCRHAARSLTGYEARAWTRVLAAVACGGVAAAARCRSARQAQPRQADLAFTPPSVQRYCRVADLEPGHLPQRALLPARLQLPGSARVGVLAVIPVALILGYLFAVLQDQRRRRRRAAATRRCLSAAAATVARCLRGGRHRHPQRSASVPGVRHPAADDRAAAWLAPTTTAARCLMESPATRRRPLDAHPARLDHLRGQRPAVVPALRAPAGRTRHPVDPMRRTPGHTDQVWRQLHASPGLAHYTLVYSDPDHLIYTERPAT